MVRTKHEGLLQRISSAVDSRISSAFDRLGRLTAQWPYTILIVSTLFTVGCGLCFLFLFQQELDNEDLYTPPNAQSFRDMDFVVDTFGEPGEEIRVLVTRDVDLKDEPDCDRRNLLRSNSDARRILNDYMDLYEHILNLSVTYKGKAFTLDDVCHVLDSAAAGCEIKSILGVWSYNRAVLNADRDLIGSIHQALERGYLPSRLGVPAASSFVLGQNQKPGPCKGTAEVFQMAFTVENTRVTIDGLTKDPESSAWNQELVKFVTQDWKPNRNLIGGVSNFNSVDVESQKAIGRDVRKLIVGYMLIFVFSHIVLFKNSPVFCKSHLASGSIISVVMAIVSAFGLAQLFGVKFNLVVQTLPFILLGLGMDDTFVIMGAYSSTSIESGIEDRMGATMARAGSSILVTSLTDAAAFVAGTLTQLPALRDFAIYAFLGITFDFLYQVTFFAALVVLDARREHRARMGAPYCGLQFGCGKTEFDDFLSLPGPSMPDPTESKNGPIGPSVTKGKNWKRKIIGVDDFDKDKPSMSTRLAGEWLPKVTLHPIGLAVVGIIEVCVLAAAIYGSTRVKMDFRYREWFVPKTSYLSKAIAIENEYFFGDQNAIAIFTRVPKDGSDFFFHQDEYENLISAVKQEEYVSKIPPVISWYDVYSEWLRSESPFANDLDKKGRVTNATGFTDSVRMFLDDPVGVYFKDSVIFGENGIAETKFACYSLNIVDGSIAVATVDNVRSAVESAAPVFEPGAFALTFLFYEGFKLITWETVRNVLIAGVVVFILTTIVLANIVASIIVTLMIALTDTMLFGFLWFAGLSFNTVTAINMVLAVGIAVDYSAHIAHSFLVLSGSRKERAQGALHHIGGEVLAGAFTTWLAISVMGFAEHYIFKTFFKMFFAIVVTGAWHGVVVLPIVLSIIGPPPCSDMFLDETIQLHIAA